MPLTPPSPRKRGEGAKTNGVTTKGAERITKEEIFHYVYARPARPGLPREVRPEPEARVPAHPLLPRLPPVGRLGQGADGAAHRLREPSLPAEPSNRATHSRTDLSPTSARPAPGREPMLKRCADKETAASLDSRPPSPASPPKPGTTSSATAPRWSGSSTSTRRRSPRTRPSARSSTPTASPTTRRRSSTSSPASRP